jgi:hypothetical protein
VGEANPGQEHKAGVTAAETLVVFYCTPEMRKVIAHARASRGRLTRRSKRKTLTSHEGKESECPSRWMVIGRSRGHKMNRKIGLKLQRPSASAESIHATGIMRGSQGLLDRRSLRLVRRDRVLDRARLRIRHGEPNGARLFPHRIERAPRADRRDLARALIHCAGRTLGKFAVKAGFLVILATVLFGVLINRAGLIIALLALVLVSAAASEKFRFEWKAAAGLFVLIAFCALVFVKGLGVPMPLIDTWFGE